jgi:nicotinamidase-related amidase
MYVPEVVPEADRETMVEKGGYGDTVGFGDDLAVLVVDMTREFVEDQYPNGYAETGQPAARAIGDLVETAREAGIRCFYSRPLKGSHALERGRWSDTSGDVEGDEAMTEFAPQLAPTEADVVVEKFKPSMFFGTQLESLLNQDGADTLVVTGMTTSGCVRATILDAFSYNYRIVVPEECTADRSQLSHESTLFDVDMKYGDVRPLADVIDHVEGT